MATCKDCVHYDVCKRIDYELEYHNKSIKEAEEELPIKCRFFKNKADVVPVVRCEQCKHSRDRNKEEKRYLIDGVLICTNCEATEDGWCAKYPNDYCSYGERKE